MCGSIPLFFPQLGEGSSWQSCARRANLEGREGQMQFWQHAAVVPMSALNEAQLRRLAAGENNNNNDHDHKKKSSEEIQAEKAAAFCLLRLPHSAYALLSTLTSQDDFALRVFVRGGAGDFVGVHSELLEHILQEAKVGTVWLEEASGTRTWRVPLACCNVMCAKSGVPLSDAACFDVLFGSGRAFSTMKERAQCKECGKPIIWGLGKEQTRWDVKNAHPLARVAMACGIAEGSLEDVSANDMIAFALYDCALALEGQARRQEEREEKEGITGDGVMARGYRLTQRNMLMWAVFTASYGYALGLCYYAMGALAMNKAGARGRSAQALRGDPTRRCWMERAERCFMSERIDGKNELALEMLDRMKQQCFQMLHESGPMTHELALFEPWASPVVLETSASQHNWKSSFTRPLHCSVCGTLMLNPAVSSCQSCHRVRHARCDDKLPCARVVLMSPEDKHRSFCWGRNRSIILLWKRCCPRLPKDVVKLIQNRVWPK